jgi:hypothetical protein
VALWFNIFIRGFHKHRYSAKYGKGSVIVRIPSLVRSLNAKNRRNVYYAITALSANGFLTVKKLPRRRLVLACAGFSKDWREALSKGSVPKDAEGAAKSNYATGVTAAQIKNCTNSKWKLRYLFLEAFLVGSRKEKYKEDDLKREWKRRKYSMIKYYKTKKIMTLNIDGNEGCDFIIGGNTDCDDETDTDD